jgi:hypothetical protein
MVAGRHSFMDANVRGWKWIRCLATSQARGVGLIEQVRQLTVMAIKSFCYLRADDGSVHLRVGTTFFTLSAEERPAVKVTVGFVRNSSDIGPVKGYPVIQHRIVTESRCQR